MKATEPIEEFIIPTQFKGKQNDLEYTVTANTKQEAIYIFKRACNRLLCMSKWDKLSAINTEFKLNHASIQQHELSREGDYLQIDIPGPGTAQGDGYDWVKVDKIVDKRNENAEEESFAVRLSAATNPNKTQNETAHFFEQGATSTFIIKRIGNKVLSSYHGRNEVVNINVKKTTDKMRNVVVAAGALAGLSELQWNSLIKAFLD